MNKLRKPAKLLNLFINKLHRNKSMWSPNKIVKSHFQNVNIPEVPLTEYIWKNLEKWPEKIAVECGITGRSYKYREIYNYSQRFAVHLRRHLNVKDGDIVCVMLPNVPEYPIATLGILEAGCIMTTINPIYTAYEVQTQLQLCNAKIIITSTATENTIRQTFTNMKNNLPIITIREFDEALPNNTACFHEIINQKLNDFAILNEVRCDVDDVCLLPYSSGTTGLPKGVELTNYNLVSNCEQMSNNEVRHHNETTANHQDIVLQLLPAFHIYGLSVIMLHKLSVGAKLITLPSFTPKTFIDTFLKHKINLLYAVPPIVLFMGSNLDINAKTLDHLELTVSAAAPLPLSDVHALLTKSHKKLKFIQAYGLTETSPLVTSMMKTETNYTSVGYALPNTELKIVDADNNIVGPNKVGELNIRGPQVMKGYRNNVEATEECITEDGWFKSGDLASIDEYGAVKIADRLKELIKVKGYQVAPAELENILREHPNIKDAAVIRHKHKQFGEVPKAFIVVKNSDKINAKDIMDFVSRRVASYKNIREIQFVNELPKTASGKILRRLLK